MKKNLVSVAVLFSALTLQANAFAKDLSGAGSWKDNQGNAGRYTATLSVEKQGDDMAITKKIMVGDQTRTIAFVVHKVDDTWFKIEMDGEKVGGGYCWTVAANKVETEAGKVCHYGVKADKDVMVEETLKITDAKIYNIGHKWDPNSKVAVTWNGSFTANSLDK